MPGKGQVVLFLRGDRPTMGVADGGGKAGKIHVVAPDGKRLQIQPSGILAEGPGSQGRERDTAREWEERISTAAAQVPVEEVWELLEGSDPMPAGEIAGQWADEGFEDYATVLAALWSDRVYFSRKKDVLAPEPRARVEERLARARDQERKAERMQRLADALQRILGGEVDLVPDVDEGDWDRFLRVLSDVAVRGQDAQNAGEVLEVMRMAGARVPDAAFDVLVRRGVFTPDENLDLILYGVRTRFPDEVDEEARRVADRLGERQWREGRTEAGPPGAVTIDSASTREVDDALSVQEEGEGWLIGIHIADVSTLMDPTSPVVAEAAARGGTLYTPDLVVPMLPDCLGPGGHSLDEGVERPSLSLVARIGRDGEPREWRFERTRLAVARRLDYETADRLVDEGDPVVRPLYEMSLALLDWRRRQGAVELDLPELTVSVDEVGEVEVSVTRGTSPSHRLVSECAVLYNRLAAAFLVERGVEAVFRTQPEPDDELPDTVAGGPAAELAARRLLESSRMERTPGRHHMLGLDAYTMASSPIRRAFDLLMQWQISATLDEGGKDPLDAAGLDALLLRAGEAYGALGRIERNRKRYWLLRYLHTKVEGAIVTAVVVDRQSDRVLLHLPEYAMEVPVRTRDPEAFRTGEEREVRIDRADARRDLVRVSIVR